MQYIMPFLCCCLLQVTSVLPDSVRPHGLQPTKFLRPWDSPGKNTGVGCHFFSNAWKWKVKVKSLSRVWLLATPWTAAYQAPPSMGFSRQEYWSGVPLPSPTLLIGWLNYGQYIKVSQSHVSNLDLFPSALDLYFYHLLYISPWVSQRPPKQHLPSSN